MVEVGDAAPKNADPPDRAPRVRTWRLVLLVLLAGWLPSLLMAFIAYAYLQAAFQERIQVNELNVVRAMSRLVEADLGQSAEVVEYYQTLPKTREISQHAPDKALQDWLASVYYSHPRIDGVFLTDAQGRLLGSLPFEKEQVGKDFNGKYWLRGAASTQGAYISPVFPRKPDDRLNSAIVVRITKSDGTVTGYLGASILVERMGKRLREINLSQGGVLQVLDQNGFPLFGRDFSPNPFMTPIAEQELLSRFHGKPSGHFEFGEFLYTFSELDPAHWVAVFEQPVAVAYGPVRELVARITLLATWLLLGTAFVAWIVAKLYRKQLEFSQGIERASLLNEKILANIPVGIAQIDPSRRTIVQANQKFLDMLNACGLSRDSRGVPGTAIDKLPFVSKDIFDRVLATGEVYSAREQRIVDPEDSPHYHKVNLLRLSDSAKRTQGLLLIVEDQTEDLLLRRQLIEANTSKDQFLAVLSHELRNPLSPVITMAAELEDTYGQEPEAKRAIEVIRRNVELEARLIDDLLDVTRIANGKLQLQMEVVDAHDSIRRAVEICESDILEKNLTLELRLDARQHHTNADPARLQQVFWNLIKNAIKFSQAGRCIVIGSENRENRLQVAVQDQGIGIPKEKLRTIFKAFEQGESSITRHFGGLGLGLAISRAMIEAHGGTLTADSEGKGRGATFFVSLITVKATPSSEVPRAVQTVPPVELRGKRVLLVDDHEDTSRGLSRLLQRRGMEVRVAGNTEEALELAATHDFDAVLSDLGLPDRSGFELMAELRDRYQLRGIALSGFGMEGDVQRSIESGFSEHLTKPVNIERLDEALRSLLAERENSHIV